MQPGTNGNLDSNYAGSLTVPTVARPSLPDNSIALPNGLRSISVNPATWFGTGSQRVLVPEVTCNPKAGLKKGQYFNPDCFTVPTYGQEGSLVFPYLRGPAYFNSDLALYKNFKITESQKFQLRIQAQNFLNHPLKQFNLANSNDTSLNFQKTTTVPDPLNSEQTIQIVSQSKTNTNGSTTGVPAATTGSRILLLSAKYYF